MPVAAGWGVVLGQLVGPATVVAVSPFSIVAAIFLVLHTNRPVPNGLAFLAGRLVGLAAGTAAFMQAPRLLRWLNRPISPPVLVGLGAILLVFAVWAWVGRNRMTEEPAWLNTISRIRPAGAAALGCLFVLTNPKMLAANAAAGVLIGAGGFGVAGASGAIAYYSILASSTVAVPVFAYLAVGQRSEPQLTRFRRWLHRRSGAVTAAILLVVGVALILSGLGAT
jgi:hypothetical protein